MINRDQSGWLKESPIGMLSEEEIGMIVTKIK